ncbi:MAG TPA: helix-turn-helix domain-containing protein [Blastocatellia bacterium]|nr:helix-turn-helix domain-containing protein [Blastocatellia bacterium]
MMTRAGADNAEEIAKSLKRSLENADRGLSLFLASLDGSGLPDALKGYRQLQMVLIQQRLWAHNHSRAELVPLFQSIAGTAARIHAILSPYAELMRPLKDLDSMTAIEIEQADTHPSPPPEPKSRKKPLLPRGRQVSTILKSLMAGGPLSSAQLAKATGKDTAKLQKDLDMLVKSGVILREGSARRPLYRLAPRFIRESLLALRQL